MFIKTTIPIILLLIIGNYILSFSQTICLPNSSFERGVVYSLGSRVPDGWQLSGGSADAQPGNWGVTQTASDSNYYMAFCNWEKICTDVPGCLQAGKKYKFSLDASLISSDYYSTNSNNYNASSSNCVLPLMGVWGSNHCDSLDELLFDTVITHIGWQKYTIEFVPSQTYCKIIIGFYNEQIASIAQCTGITAGYSYFGIDNLSCIYSEKSVKYTNQTCYSSCDGTAKIEMMTGTPPFGYVWTPGAYTTDSISGLCTGKYYVNITDSIGNTFLDSVEIIAPPALVVSDTITPASCGKQDGEIHVSVSGGVPNYTYNWSNNTTLNKAIGLAAQNYSLLITDSNLCQTQYSYNVPEMPGPTISYTSNINSGCPSTCINFGLDAANNGTMDSILWDFGDGNTANTNSPIHCYTQSGTYSTSVWILDTAGCASRQTIENHITIFPTPKADFFTQTDETTISNPEIVFFNTSTGAHTQSWYFRDTYGGISTEKHPKHFYSDTGLYCTQLIVENTFSCKDTIEKCVYIKDDFIFYAPNAFTPNDDATNNFFRGVGSGIVEYQMWIFDRWGSLVYNTGKCTDPDQAESWNGKTNNNLNPAQQDVYVWKVVIKDLKGNQHNFIGHVTIVR
ncbi:MAG: gliding motility-associated C-terminal domain-containing protein [Bacteroidetes bacterium]|nr:gliding motility-associated C-terminal domain-containing protein [Bacteroidota bacterium]